MTTWTLLVWLLVLFRLGSNGVKACKMGCMPCGFSLHEIRTRGQVGQESNLQPAVVEHALRYPGSSKVVQFALGSAVFDDVFSRLVQERLTAL
jgi:hypothetical protein